MLKTAEKKKRSTIVNNKIDYSGIKSKLNIGKVSKK
jgi:hypothetical protein